MGVNSTGHDLDVSFYSTRSDFHMEKTGIPITSGMVKKTICNTNITNKIPCFTCLVATTSLNAKATEIENKIPNVATKVALNTKLLKLKVKYPTSCIYNPSQNFQDLLTNC